MTRTRFEIALDLMREDAKLCSRRLPRQNQPAAGDFVAPAEPLTWPVKGRLSCAPEAIDRAIARLEGRDT